MLKIVPTRHGISQIIHFPIYISHSHNNLVKLFCWCFLVESEKTQYLQLTKTSLLTNTIFQLSPSYSDFLLLTDLPSHTHNCALIASKNIWKWLQLKTCMCVHVHILPKFPHVSIMNISGMQCAQKNIPSEEKDSDFVLEIVFFHNWEINTISTEDATRPKSSSWFRF